MKLSAVCNSGGMDSVFVMEKLISQGHDIVSVHVNIDSQLSHFQSDAAKLFSVYYGVKHHEINIDFGIDVHNYKQNLGLKDSYKGVAAYRGAVTVAAAASLARMLGCQGVYTGQYYGDFIDHNAHLKLMAGLLGAEVRAHENPVPHPAFYIGITNEEAMGLNEWAKKHPLKDKFVYCAQEYPPCGKCYKCKTRHFLR